MTGLILFLIWLAALTFAGIFAAVDMRPQDRPREWSVGRLIEPRS